VIATFLKRIYVFELTDALLENIDSFKQ